MVSVEFFVKIAEFRQFRALFQWISSPIHPKRHLRPLRSSQSVRCTGSSRCALLRSFSRRTRIEWGPTWNGARIWADWPALSVVLRHFESGRRWKDGRTEGCSLKNEFWKENYKKASKIWKKIESFNTIFELVWYFRLNFKKYKKIIIFEKTQKF